MRNLHKQASIYQVYIKSFSDSNGDGIGDLQGIRSRLPYIAKLGVEYIWITPFLCSPQDDNGYDISDYRAIEPMFGTMADFEALIADAGQLGLKIMMDMVLNHTSSQHEWFQKALAGDPVYQDYYIFRAPGPNREAPNNWTSRFGGTAWEYVPALNKFYLHLYAISQPDLNWENPSLRQEIYDILNFWLDKGVQGMRLDVINQVSKAPGLPDMTPGDQEPFTNGPRVHEFIRELNKNTFGPRPDVLTVGELCGCDVENLSRFTNPESEELDTAFQFHHMRADYVDNEKWSLGSTDYGLLKRTLFSWVQETQEKGGCLSLFWGNHDQPRAISRFGDPVNAPEKSAKAIATALYWMGGVPSVFNGEELGMTNAGFTGLEQYRDVESLNHYQILLNRGKTEKESLAILAQKSRDNGRTTVPWDNSHSHGFTKGEPWIWGGDSAFRSVCDQVDDPDSIYSFYRELLKKRLEHEAGLTGKFIPLQTEDDRIFTYLKQHEQETLLVVSNLEGTKKPLPPAVKAAAEKSQGLVLIQTNSGKTPSTGLPPALEPWDAFVFQI